MMTYHIWHRKPGTEMWHHKEVRAYHVFWVSIMAVVMYPGQEVQVKKGSVD
ncbi:hypothetical protein SEA_FRIBS8_33 [Gordonia phage Fribs8]|nr:hypothetical protein SEA_FRIBS8_33 [Gordonia phage Fribs8]